jgi:hypothetical protein
MRSARVVSRTAFVLLITAAALVSRVVATQVVPADRRSSTTEITDVTGRPLSPFAPAGAANVIFFIATDCPISNSYAPEIQRICKDYAAHDVSCALMYEDADLSSSASHLDASVRRHLQEYRYSDIPAAIDRSRTIAKRAKASVTPQAVVIDRSGTVRYRGRIDNFYAALGHTRREVTARDLRDAVDAVLSGRSVRHAETEAVGCFIVDPSEFRK